MKKLFIIKLVKDNKIILCYRPSSSQRENLPQDIFDAELVGRNGSCLKYNLLCPVGLFDLIGIFGSKSSIAVN